MSGFFHSFFDFYAFDFALAFNVQMNTIFYSWGLLAAVKIWIIEEE